MTTGKTSGGADETPDTKSYQLKFMNRARSSRQRRSQRVPLQVVVIVRANMPDGRCLQAQAFTSVVNAHGGLLESPMKLATNQKILLINPNSGVDAICKVVQVEGPKLSLYDVAFEFDQRSPQFWPIDFPPEDWAGDEAIISEKS